MRFALVLPLLLLAACGYDAPPASDLPAVATAAPVESGDVVIERVDSEEASFRVVRLATGIEHPWGLAFLPGGRMLVTERPGRMLLIEGDQRTEITGLPEIRAERQGGLLDVQLHPDYDDNGWIYFAYSAVGEGGMGTALARARLSETALTDLEVLYDMEQRTDRGHHFGSRIAFMEDGTVLFTIGDRGEMERAQDLMDPAGSTIRLTADGQIPDDNPFVGRDDVLPELYTVGNRNAQGMAVHPETGVVWQTEHGPRGGDELNRIVPGANYGWPTVSEGADYRTRRPVGASHDDRPEFTEPAAVWTPSIATSGTHFYTGSAFPGWQNHLFVGGLALQQIRRVVLDGDTVTHQETLLEGAIGRIRTVTQGPDGYLYILTDAADGGIFRLEPVE